MLKRSLRIDTAEVFEPLLYPARYKGASGGRGSAKSHFFADLMVEDAVLAPSSMGEGLRGVCIREIQKSLKESAKRLIEIKIRDHGLGERDGFKIFKDVIETPGDGIIMFQGMQDTTAENAQSLEGMHRAWCEEAHTLSSRSLMILRPTIRWEDKIRGLASELWFSWNPRRKTDPVDEMFRGGEMPTGAVHVQSNWSDNPWFPSVLEQERQDCQRATPEQYNHIWEGDYATIYKGAYYSTHLTAAQRDGRIGRVAVDPLMQIKAIWDIGGAGQSSDATAIWIAQFVGKEIRVLNYHESQGQPLSHDVAWLRQNGYDGARCILPHDGATSDRVHKVSYRSALKEAGFSVEVIPNQGKGAAMLRVEAARRRFPAIWFNEDTTEAGRDALAWYHEKYDEARAFGLGPEHDWASHGADAFGLMCVAYRDSPASGKAIRYRAKPRFTG